MVTNNLLSVGENESFIQFRNRLCRYKHIYNITWEDIRDILNEYGNFDFSESYYRKNAPKWLAEDETEDTQEVVAETDDISKETVTDPEVEYDDDDEFTQKIIALKKEKMKLSEERIQANAYIRRLAREDTIKEIAHDTAMLMNTKKILNVVDYDKIPHSSNEALLLLSDWHYGIVCNNFWNKYDPDVAEQRLSTLLSKVIYFCEKNDVRKITVLNLGDLICGRIHLALRLESRFDVITQVLKVSEILSEFLFNLSQKLHVDVDYYDCIDNHSRIEPNKTDAIDLETLARVIPPYIKERLENLSYKNGATNVINVCDNIYGEDIITFNLNGYSVAAVHGDKDAPTQVIDGISMMTRQPYDLICSAHMHHHSEDEKNYTELISNGSLMGTDSYAKDKRLTSKPSQTLVIASPYSVREAVYKIDLI